MTRRDTPINNGDSNRTGFTAPDGSTNTYTYDTLNRLSTLANSWAGPFGFSYDALSRRTQMTRPNGVATNYSYDSLSRLLSVLHQTGSKVLDGEVYTLDPAGNRTSKQDDLAGATSNYTYDAIYELTQVTQGTNTTESYSYDPVGNRLSSLGVSSYTNNTSNELTSTSAASYTYDSNGNTLTKVVGSNTTSYAWDFENRLTQVTLPGTSGTVQFRYDPFGRRIQKVFTTGANPPTTTTTNYLYDGDNEIEQVDQNGNILSRFAQDQNIDEPLALSASGAASFYEQDGLGSVTSLTNGSGSVAQTYTYDSFGKLTNSSGNVTNPFRYTGRDFDTETNLYYNRARYLDQSTGRFLSEDPIRYLGGSNFYDYARNNTPDLVDPLGLSPVCTWVGSSELASWTTATRRYTSPWMFITATQDGGPDQKSHVIFANLHCTWGRNYVRQVWQNTMYLNTYLCVDHLACGLNLVWFEFNVDTKKRYMGEEPGGTEKTTTSRWVLGYESDFLDWMYCHQSGMVPQN